MNEQQRKNNLKLRLAIEHGRLDAIKTIRAWFPSIKPVSLKTIREIQSDTDSDI